MCTLSLQEDMDNMMEEKQQVEVRCMEAEARVQELTEDIASNSQLMGSVRDATERLYADKCSLECQVRCTRY